VVNNNLHVLHDCEPCGGYCYISIIITTIKQMQKLPNKLQCFRKCRKLLNIAITHENTWRHASLCIWYEFQNAVLGEKKGTCGLFGETCNTRSIIPIQRQVQYTIPLDQ